MKKILRSIFTIVLSFGVLGQNETKKWDIRLSAFEIITPKYAEYAFPIYSWETGEITRSFPISKYWTYRVEGNYQIHKSFQVGLWSSYGLIQGLLPNKTHALGNGVKVNTQLLPLFFEKFRERNSRLSVYASAEFGGFYFRNQFIYASEYGGGSTMKPVATVGGGVSLYITKQVGVFFDYQYGGFLTRKTFENNRTLSVPKFGLTVRF